MRATRDSFLHFIADNIGIPVHALRRDPNNPEAGLLKMNAVNIHFLDGTYEIAVSSEEAVIDVINDDELVAVDWCKQVWDLLSAAGYTPKLDYSQTPPATTGSCIFWKVNGVRFRAVASDSYFHFSLQLTLHHKAI